VWHFRNSLSYSLGIEYQGILEGVLQGVLLMNAKCAAKIVAAMTVAVGFAIPAFAGHWCAVGPPRRKLAGQHRHHRIVSQLVMVVEVLIAQRNPEHPLTDQRRNAMLDQLLTAVVDEAGRKPIDHSDRAVRCPQQERASVRRDRSALKVSNNFATLDGCKFEQFRATLCLHRGLS
jgi:hypothetical protein